MIFGSADAREIKRVAANAPCTFSQAFEAAGGHLLSMRKALGRVCFAQGAESGEFFSLGLTAVWRWESGGQPGDGESQEGGELHCGDLVWCRCW